MWQLQIVTFNISLLPSYGLWPMLRVYKHSAPPELARFSRWRALDTYGWMPAHLWMCF